MASEVHKEKIQLDIEIGGDKARKKLNDLKDQSRDLREEQKFLRKEKSKLVKTDADYKENLNRINKLLRENRAALDKNKSAQKKLRNEIGMSALTTRELKDELRHLQQVQANLVPDTPKWHKYQAKINQVKQRMEQLRTGSSKLAMGLKSLASTVNHYAGMFMALGFAVYGAYNLFVKGNKELSDQLTDVQKRTNLTKVEILSLYGTLLKLDTRTPREELLQLAEVAGRLGIRGRKNILGFVSAADKIKVSIGEDLGDNAETAIREVGKLVDIFKLDEQYGLEKSMIKIASAINEIGQNSTAQEKYIVDFTKRVAGIAPQADISITKVMGIAAALDILGQSAEVSSTVYAQVIPGMFKDTETYAEIAGVSVEEFSKLLKTDANEAFILLLEGLHGNNEGMQAMSEKLDTLGLDGKRVTTVLGALSNNVELVREQQELANRTFTDGTSVVDEYNRKNANLASNIEKIGKVIKEVFVGGSILRTLEKITGKIWEWMKIPMSQMLADEKKEANLLYMRLTDVNLASDERKKILTKLKEISPDIVKGISSEAINMDTLRKNLAKYNEEMVKRIALENLREDEQKKLNDQASALERLWYTQTHLDEQMLAINEDLALSEGTRIERYQKIKKHLQDIVFENGQLENHYSDEATQLAKLNDTYINLKKNTEAYNDATAEAFDFSKKIEAFRKQMGVEENKGSASSGSGGSSGSDGGNSEVVAETIDVESLRIAALERGKAAELALEEKRHKEKLKKYKHNSKALEYEALIHSKNVADINLKYLDKQIADATFNHGQKMAFLQQAYENEEITKAEFDERKRQLEYKFQEDMHNFKMQYKVASSDELMNMEIEKIQATYEFKQLTTEEQEAALEAIRQKWGKRRKKQMAANIQDEIDIISQGYSEEQMMMFNRTKNFMNMSAQLGEAMGEAFYGMLSGQKDFAQQFLLIALDMIQQYINLLLVKMMAESLAMADSVATWGATGLARYAILSGLVNAAFGVVKAAIKGSTRQKRKGGYATVTGEDDGMTYNAQILGSAGTGWLPNHPVLMPSGILASEAGQEYYVDTPSLNSSLRDQMGLSIADHVGMIEAMKHNTTPQRANGGYGNQDAAPSMDITHLQPQYSKEFQEAMVFIAKNGISASMPYSGRRGFKETLDKYQRRENAMSFTTTKNRS